VEQETPRSHDEIPQISDFEDSIMSMTTTTEEPFDTKPHEQQVGQGVDDLGGVFGGIVVLMGRLRTVSTEKEELGLN
jgi:hypothetical protein